MSKPKTYTITKSDPRSITVKLKRGKDVVEKDYTLRVGTVWTVVPDNPLNPKVDAFRNQIQESVFNEHLKPATADVQADKKA